jgi:hypothetical protein
MGMGKTVSTLTALDTLGSVYDDVFPALVLGPKRVARDVWPDEAKKWAHLSGLGGIVPAVGSESDRRHALAVNAPITSINYDVLDWLVTFWGDRWPYKTVVADEATRLKNYRGSVQKSKTGKEFVKGGGGIRARALGRVAHSKVTRFIELTGTPAPNGLANLWGQMWFLDAGKRLARTYSAFRARWFDKGEDGFSVVPRSYAQEQIHAAVNDLCLSLDAADYFDIKQPIVNNIYVDLPPDARARYREMEREMFTEISGGEVEAFGAAARTQKCLQLASGAVYLTQDEAVPASKKEWRAVHDAKLEALDSVIENANGMPQMVVYEFRSDLARIKKAYPEAVDLATDKGLAAFRTGTKMIGLAHPASLGHGVDGLQDVTNIITFFGHNWNLELYDQIVGRIGPVRQMQSGHDRPVYINHIIARNTVDEHVMLRRETKRSVQDILMEAMKRKAV